MRVSYLGPPGTFSDSALVEAAGTVVIDAVPFATLFDVISAVSDRRVDLGLVPFENSIDGSVRPTLDALAFEVEGVELVGEYDLAIRHALIVANAASGPIEKVYSHPQPLAQCARYLREQHPEVELVATSSTADAIAGLHRAGHGAAAIGPASSADRYGCVVWEGGIEDFDDNRTRFVWVARVGESPQRAPGGEWRTVLSFSELGDDRPGALVDALTEFASRQVNLIRLESRPLRRGLDRYMFFVDLEGDLGDEPIAAAIEALRAKAENVRILGSYPLGVSPLEDPKRSAD